MKINSIVPTLLILVCVSASAFAQDGNYNMSHQNQVLTDNSQTIFLHGRINTGWAGNIYNGSNTNTDDFRSQFFINRAYVTLSGEMNENIAFRVRLDCINEMEDQDLLLKNAYMRVSNINYLGLTSKLYFGIVPSIWESFENQIWRYRLLRRAAAGMFDYINEAEVGANYFMNFNSNQVNLGVGLWNGDYRRYSTLGFGEEVNEQFTDANYSAGVFMIYNHSGFNTRTNKYNGLIVAAGSMMNSMPGDDDDANVGYRLFGGIYYVYNRPELDQLLTVGLSGGYIDNHTKINEFGNDVIDNKYYADGFIILNFAMFSPEARDIELVFRLDYNYYGRQGEGYLLPDEDVHQFAVTIALSYRPYSWLWIVPAFKGDYVDFGQDANQIGLWIELRY